MRFEAYGAAQPLASLERNGRATVEVQVRSVSLFRGRRGPVLRVRVEDASAQEDLNVFGQPFLRSRFSPGTLVTLRVARGSSGALRLLRLDSASKPLPRDGRREAVYRKIANVPAAVVRSAIRQLLERAETLAPETLEVDVLERCGGLLALPEALRVLHSGDGIDPRRTELARRRLALEEWLTIRRQIARVRRQRGFRAEPLALSHENSLRLRRAIGVVPTRGQEEAMAAVERGVARGEAWRALVQGDVGCGKTLVGLWAVALAALSGRQAVFLAPTEVLASQHGRWLAPILEVLGIEVAGLSGSLSAQARRTQESRIASGHARVIIGTHAVIRSSVRLESLAVAVIDEPQKFGVEQRDSIARKRLDGIHLIGLSATPIPRSLALALSGEIELVTIADRPAGRGRVVTRVLRSQSDRRAFVGQTVTRLRRGERAFVVCPRIGAEDDEASVASVHSAAKRWRRLLPPDIAMSVLHGRMDPESRDEALEAFRRGRSPLLIASSLIELGIDVPEATVLLVEGAERFGLAALHQLRGRIGRGPLESEFAIDGDASATERFDVLERTSDGFEIAELDLRLRGMGDLLGSLQSGAPRLHVADPERDLDLLRRAGELAARERADARSPEPTGESGALSILLG